jgi:hypothetical protein
MANEIAAPDAAKGVEEANKMSNKRYTAEPREDGQILVHLPGVGYHLELDEARKLRDSLNAALGEGGEATPQNLQIDARIASDYMDLTNDLLQSNRQYAQRFANLTEQLQGSLASGVELERKLKAAEAHISKLETQLEEANEKASMLARRPEER